MKLVSYGKAGVQLREKMGSLGFIFSRRSPGPGNRFHSEGMCISGGSKYRMTAQLHLGVDLQPFLGPKIDSRREAMGSLGSFLIGKSDCFSLKIKVLNLEKVK